MSDFFGEVDLFGLDEFGIPFIDGYGGIVLGLGISAFGPMAVRKIPNAFAQQNANLVAAVAGAAVGGILWKTGRGLLGAQTAITAITAGVFNWIAAKAEGGLAGLGVPTVNYLNGLGLPQVEYLNGFGMASIENTPVAYGTIPGVYGAQVAGPQLSADNQPPVDLLGQPTAASQQVSLLGGPPVSGLASMYGATLFGGN
jgi:hypothetical protein